MDRTLACPSCAAPLHYAATQEPTIVCSFCGTTVVVPQEWRPYSPGTYTPPRGPVPATSPAYWAIGVAALCGALLVALLVLARTRRTPSPHPRPYPTPLKAPTQPNSSDPPVASGLGTAVLTFGHEGIGPGLFKDARSVAVDGGGKIYVGEYMERRVQVFDQTGKFLTQWMVRAEMAVSEMTADRNGYVYIEGGGTIWRFEGSTGKEMGHMDFPGGSSMFNDVVATPDGGLTASQFNASDNIVRFDSSGKTTLLVRKAVSAQSDRPEPQIRIAVDGLGNIYALSSFSNAVYKF